MFQVSAGDQTFNLGLIVVDMQNGFVSKGGSYDLLGMNTQEYQKIIPKTKELIEFCRRIYQYFIQKLSENQAALIC